MLLKTLAVMERPIVCLSFQRRITPRIRLAISGYSIFLPSIPKQRTYSSDFSTMYGRRSANKGVYYLIIEKEYKVLKIRL